jgi:hypothetical protein
MVVMHGLFDLQNGVEEHQFKRSFEAFSDALRDLELIVESRFMRHQEHDGYNADAPRTKYYVNVDFTDMVQAERCWTWIEDKSEPVQTLHQAVFSKVDNASFFLTTQT